jgi:hypothetical protein
VAIDASKLPASIVHGDRKAKGAFAITVRDDSNADFNGPVTVSVLASADAVADAQDVVVVQSSKRLKLKVGQTKVLKLKTSLAMLPDGSYTLIGAASAGNNLTSTQVGPALQVAPAFVHLVSGGTATPPKKPITAGKPVTLVVPLRNDGNAPTTKTPSTYTLIFSTTGTEAGAAGQTTATGKVNLKAGVTKPQKVRFTLPAGSVSAGSYTVLVKISAELNDTSGQVIATVPVTVI